MFSSGIFVHSIKCMVYVMSNISPLVSSVLHYHPYCSRSFWLSTEIVSYYLRGHLVSLVYFVQYDSSQFNSAILYSSIGGVVKFVKTVRAMNLVHN